MKNKSIRLTILSVVLLATAPAALAQDAITIERDKVLANYGKVIWKPTPLPIQVGKGVGVVGKQDVTQSNTQTLRLHFKVLAAPQAPTWALSVTDTAGGVVWTYSPASKNETDFWSDEVPGNLATVEVFSTVEENPLQLVVDGVAVAQTPVRPEAITPPDDREPITTQSAETKGLGRAVARIRFVGDDGNQYVCTGFLISTDLFMTNHHCPQSDSEWRSTLVDFDYDTSASIPKTTRFREFVLSDAGLDFAIYRLAAKQTNRSPLALSGAVPVANQALLIIEHPGGEAKQVSKINCRVSRAPVAGVTNSLTDFGHLCDTLGGSSGSEMLDLATKKVIGLHHLGFGPNDSSPVNRAVMMGQIINFIGRNRPDIKAEVGLAP